jgi:hypothetical protein
MPEPDASARRRCRRQGGGKAAIAGVTGFVLRGAGVQKG